MAVVALDSEGGPKRTDEEWVAAALRDMRAFAPLYARYYLPVYTYCRIRLRSDPEAEDATSDAFMRAMQSLPTFRGASFRSWLFSIVANLVRNTVRDRRPAVPLPSGSEAEDLDPAVSPEGTALAGEETATVQHLLARLSPSQRAVVELRLAGLLTREIADVLGMTPDAVKVAQWRAFKRLRTWLEHDHQYQGSTETTDA